jgi:hypothetical protein
MTRPQSAHLNSRRRPDLSVEQILAWADAHRLRAGRWPTRLSSPIHGAPAGTTRTAVDAALHGGLCGLPGGTTLRRFLDKRRGAEGPDRARSDV